MSLEREKGELLTRIESGLAVERRLHGPAADGYMTVVTWRAHNAAGTIWGATEHWEMSPTLVDRLRALLASPAPPVQGGIMGGRSWVVNEVGQENPAEYKQRAAPPVQGEALVRAAVHDWLQRAEVIGANRCGGRDCFYSACVTLSRAVLEAPPPSGTGEQGGGP